MAMAIGRMGSTNVTRGTISWQIHLVVLKVQAPPKMEYMLSLPVLYRSATDTVMADHRGPDMVQVGLKKASIRFRMPQQMLVRSGLTSISSSRRKRLVSSRKAVPPTISPKAMT